MLTFNFAIFHLTMSNLPWFMDLTFQVPMQRCSLHHQDLLSLPDTFTTECYFHFDPVASFFLVLLVINCSLFFPYWTPSNLWSSSSGVINFCLCVLFMGFSQQEYWSGLPFPPPVDHVLPGLFTMTHPSWVALHSMTHTFIEFCKPLYHNRAVTYAGEDSESPLDSKEIKPVNLKGNQPWMFIERTDAEARINFRYLIWRDGSWEKTLMLGKIKGKRKRGP